MVWFNMRSSSAKRRLQAVETVETCPDGLSDSSSEQIGQIERLTSLFAPKSVL